jgi:hypothetical protein
MAVTVVFLSKKRYRKKVFKQFKSTASAKRAVDAMKQRGFGAVYYTVKRKK